MIPSGSLTPVWILTVWLKALLLFGLELRAAHPQARRPCRSCSERPRESGAHPRFRSQSSRVIAVRPTLARQSMGNDRINFYGVILGFALAIEPLTALGADIAPFRSGYNQRPVTGLAPVKVQIGAPISVQCQGSGSP